MGISHTTIITCNGCNETLDNTGNWSSFLEAVSGTAEQLFAEKIVVCGLDCFKEFAAKITTTTGQ